MWCCTGTRDDITHCSRRPRSSTPGVYVAVEPTWVANRVHLYWIVPGVPTGAAQVSS